MIEKVSNVGNDQRTGGLDAELTPRDVQYLARVGGILRMKPAEVLHVIVTLHRSMPGGESLSGGERDQVEAYRALWGEELVEDIKASMRKEGSL